MDQLCADAAEIASNLEQLHGSFSRRLGEALGAITSATDRVDAAQAQAGASTVSFAQARTVATMYAAGAGLRAIVEQALASEEPADVEALLTHIGEELERSIKAGFAQLERDQGKRVTPLIDTIEIREALAAADVSLSEKLGILDAQRLNLKDRIADASAAA